MAQNDYVSSERLYLDKEGKVVGAKDPNRQTLLVGEGGSIPEARARELGLLDAEGQRAELAGGGEESADLESKTKAELLELASEKGVEVKSSATKAEIVEALQNGGGGE